MNLKCEPLYMEGPDVFFSFLMGKSLKYYPGTECDRPTRGSKHGSYVVIMTISCQDTA